MSPWITTETSIRPCKSVSVLAKEWRMNESGGERGPPKTESWLQFCRTNFNDSHWVCRQFVVCAENVAIKMSPGERWLGVVAGGLGLAGVSHHARVVRRCITRTTRFAHSRPFALNVRCMCSSLVWLTRSPAALSPRLPSCPLLHNKYTKCNFLHCGYLQLERKVIQNEGDMEF